MAPAATEHTHDRAGWLDGLRICWQCRVNGKVTFTAPEPLEGADLTRAVRLLLEEIPDATTSEIASQLPGYSSANSAYSAVARKLGAPEKRTYAEAWKLLFWLAGREE